MDKKMTCTTTSQNLHSFNFTAVRSAAKQLIVWLAIRGLVPKAMASWLIRKGGLSHD